jgi:hypothetical protein
MREQSRFDDCVALYDDDDDADVVVVDPVFIDFVPAGHEMRCVCGAPLQPWSLRTTGAVNRVELGCDRCHRVHGHLRLGTRVYR